MVNSVTDGTTNFLLSNGGSIIYIVYGILAFLVVIMAIFMILDAKKYNKKVTIHVLMGDKYIAYDTKGGIVKNDQGVLCFKTKKFGREGFHIEQNVPPKERFYLKEQCMLNFPLLPYVLKECIDFINIKEGLYVPISHSFISIKRGQDIKLTSKEDCVFCNKHISVETYRKNPELHTDIKEHYLCEKCFTEYINARFEGVDSADLSYYWMKVDELKNKFGSFMEKWGAMIILGALLILVGFTFYLMFKYTPDLYGQISQTKEQAYYKALEYNVNQQLYNGSIPTN